MLYTVTDKLLNCYNNDADAVDEQSVSDEVKAPTNCLTNRECPFDGAKLPTARYV